MIRNNRGASLIEVLIGFVIVIIATIGALSFFSHGIGGIGTEGNRRAALERARQRLDQVMAASVSSIQPPDGTLYYLSCDPATGVCARALADPNEAVSVDDLPAQPIKTTIRWINDPAAGTSTLDVFEIIVKVWFTSRTAVDDDYNRVQLRTLRTP